MAVDKNSAEEKKVIVKEKEVEAPKKPAEKPASFCMYIGPSIRGVIQANTIYNGPKHKVEKQLEKQIERFPLIAKLIVTDKSLAEDRIKVKTAGTPLHMYYSKLVAGIRS